MSHVSIIMPVKNAAPFLEECLKSIQSQTFQDWELIAVDDHSTDGSRTILESHTRSDSRIKVLSSPGKGIIPALQHALRHTTGIYLTRMDADDLMTATRLEKMVERLKAANERTVITGLVNYFSDRPISDGYRQYESWLNEINLAGTQWQNIYRECVIASPNWMISKDDLLKDGGVDGLTYPEDYHMVLRWYQQGCRIGVVPEVTLLWREHPQRTSRNSDHYSQSAFFRLKINAFVKTDLRSEHLVLWGNNIKTRLTKDILQENEVSFHEMDLNNFKAIEQLPNPQVLIGVYPTPKERVVIGRYLENLGLRHGKEYWYL